MLKKRWSLSPMRLPPSSATVTLQRRPGRLDAVALAEDQPGEDRPLGVDELAAERGRGAASVAREQRLHRSGRRPVVRTSCPSVLSIRHAAGDVSSPRSVSNAASAVPTAGGSVNDTIGRPSSSRLRVWSKPGGPARLRRPVHERPVRHAEQEVDPLLEAGGVVGVARGDRPVERLAAVVADAGERPQERELVADQVLAGLALAFEVGEQHGVLAEALAEAGQQMVEEPVAAFEELGRRLDQPGQDVFGEGRRRRSRRSR